MVSATEDIEQSLQILLTTSPGERLMHPTYGCGLKALVFEPTSATIVTEIKDVVERAILFFEARITLNAIDIDTAAAPDGVLRILLDYTIRETNTRSNMVFPFYLIEGTNISF